MLFDVAPLQVSRIAFIPFIFFFLALSTICPGVGVGITVAIAFGMGVTVAVAVAVAVGVGVKVAVAVGVGVNVAVGVGVGVNVAVPAGVRREDSCRRWGRSKRGRSCWRWARCGCRACFWIGNNSVDRRTGPSACRKQTSQNFGRGAKD